MRRKRKKLTKLNIAPCPYSPGKHTNCDACRKKLGDAPTPCDLIADVAAWARSSLHPDPTGQPWFVLDPEDYAELERILGVSLKE